MYDKCDGLKRKEQEEEGKVNRLRTNRSLHDHSLIVALKISSFRDTCHKQLRIPYL